jgi:hypothetical protein
VYGQGIRGCAPIDVDAFVGSLIAPLGETGAVVGSCGLELKPEAAKAALSQYCVKSNAIDDLLVS